MALDFSPLQQIDPGGAFLQGRERARVEQERNMLRQQQAEQMAFQRENMLAQRGEREALAEERRAKTAATAQRQQFLTGLGAKMAEGGYKLDRPTLGQMLQYGMQSGEDSLIKLATEGMRALDEEALYSQEAARFGLPGAAAPTAAPANALAAPPAAPAGVTRETVQNMLISPSARIREQGKALAQTLSKEEATPSDVAAMKALGFPLTAAGYAQFRDAQRQERMLSPEEEKQRIRIAQASRPPVQPKEPSVQPPVAVVDETTGRVKYVTREEAIGKTPASAMEGLAPKEIQKREAALPQATASIKSVETNADTFVKQLQRLRDHPGLEGITGVVYGRTLSAKGASREAQSLYDQIQAKGGFQMLQAMREASKTGGALGNVSNEEGRRLQAAFAAIDRTQDASSVRNAIDLAIADIEGAKARSREAYESTYSYKQGGGGARGRPSLDDIFK